MKSVNMLDAKNSLSRLVAAAVDGEEVVIANRGKPAVRLVPVHATQTNTGTALASWLTQNPAPVSRARSAADIEAQLQENRDAWA
jgi:prevent-host-death family protein